MMTLLRSPGMTLATAALSAILWIFDAVAATPERRLGQLASGDVVRTVVSGVDGYELLVGDSVRHAIASLERVWNVSFTQDRKVCVILLMRSDAARSGLWYSRVISVIDRQPGILVDPEVISSLPEASLVDVQGVRHEVLGLGCCDEFPVVDLYVALTGARKLTSYRWQRWDLVSERFVGSMDVTNAEQRAVAVQRRGDLRGPVEIRGRWRREWEIEKAAQPGATDNPGNAQ